MARQTKQFGERYMSLKKREACEHNVLGGLILHDQKFQHEVFLFSPFQKDIRRNGMSDMQWWIDFNVEL